MNFENIFDLKKIIKYSKEDDIVRESLRKDRIKNQHGKCITCRYAYDIGQSCICKCIFFDSTKTYDECERYEIKRKYKKYID